MEEEIKNNVQQDNIDKATTIKISREVRDELAALGSKDETFEDVIKRLIKKSEVERSAEIVTNKSAMIQYKRKREFVELGVNIGSVTSLQPVGIEYEYNVPPKKEGEWELDIKIIKIYYEQKTYNPSEFFGVDDEHKYFSKAFVKLYFKVLANILSKEYYITMNEYTHILIEHLLNILEWRKIYYKNKLSEESFINDVEDIFRKFSDRKEDDKIKVQLKNSVVGH